VPGPAPARLAAVPTVLSRGCPIHFELHGEWPPGATPLLLIPGWGCDIRSWGELLDRLAPQRPCITVDNRGSGESGLGQRLFGVATMADDAAAVMRCLGIRHADVLGNSLGGMVTQALALRHPARVRSMVLLSSTPGLGSLPCHPSLLWEFVRHGGSRCQSAPPGRPVQLPPRARLPRRRSLVQLGAGASWFGLPVLRRSGSPPWWSTGRTMRWSRCSTPACWPG